VELKRLHRGCRFIELGECIGGRDERREWSMEPLRSRCVAISRDQRWRRGWSTELVDWWLLLSYQNSEVVIIFYRVTLVVYHRRMEFNRRWVLGTSRLDCGSCYPIRPHRANLLGWILESLWYNCSSQETRNVWSKFGLAQRPD
jgi:hypothetical protein